MSIFVYIIVLLRIKIHFLFGLVDHTRAIQVKNTLLRFFIVK